MVTKINIKNHNFIYSVCIKVIIIFHQRFVLACDWSKHIIWLRIPTLKRGNIQWYCPNVLCKKYLKDNKHSSLHLASKIYSGLTVFLELHSGKTDPFSEQMVSVDKYPSILTIVYIWLLIVDTVWLKNYKTLYIWALLLNLLSGKTQGKKQFFDSLL